MCGGIPLSSPRSSPGLSASMIWSAESSGILAVDQPDDALALVVGHGWSFPAGWAARRAWPRAGGEPGLGFSASLASLPVAAGRSGEPFGSLSEPFGSGGAILFSLSHSRRFSASRASRSAVSASAAMATTVVGRVVDGKPCALNHARAEQGHGGDLVESLDGRSARS